MVVIPNPKMAFIFTISCIFTLIFPILLKYFPKCERKGSFLKSQIKPLGSYVCNIGYQSTSADKQADNNFCEGWEMC